MYPKNVCGTTKNYKIILRKAQMQYTLYTPMYVCTYNIYLYILYIYIFDIFQRANLNNFVICVEV